jgi:UDP-glucose 4-epimerase
VLLGATGFLGGVLRKHLSAVEDLHLTAVARTMPPDLPDAEDRMHWLQADLGSPVDCDELVSRADVLVHLAHRGTPLTSSADLPSDAALNLLPTLTLLQAIRRSGRQVHVVYSSSGGAVYGDRSSAAPFHETDACMPRSSYGIQKLAAEHYLRLAADEGWLTTTVLRVGNPYGVLLPPERRQSFIGVAVANIVRGWPVQLFGDLANVRDYLHVDDMAIAFELAVRRRQAFEIFNVGSGVGHSVREVIALLERTAGCSFAVDHVDEIGGAWELPRWAVLDVSLAKRELGWRARVGLEEGVRRLFAEARKT